MKITKLSLEVEMDAEAVRRAHDGCDECPCCGNGGYTALHVGKRVKIKGFIHPKKLVVDEYRCKLCKAEWESDPFEEPMSDHDHFLHRNKIENIIYVSVMSFLILSALIFGFLVIKHTNSLNSKPQEACYVLRQGRSVVQTERQIHSCPVSGGRPGIYL